jgi:thiamine biosynthesis lipoprotein
MGTYAAVRVPAARATGLADCAATARVIFAELNDALTNYRPDSEISRLNKLAGGEPLAMSPHAIAVLALSRRYAEASGGAFDPTIAPVVLLWGFSGGRKPERVPAADRLDAARSLTGYQFLQVSNNTARLSRPGMKLDLGGIAKGYAVDVAYERIRALGVADVLVDLGGNIRCCGSGRRGRAWTVAVRNPFDAGRHLGTLALSDGLAVASSGNYERFVEIEGKRYSHIMDPRTGYPAAGMAGTTVICTNAVEADAMSTAVFLMGPERSRALRRSLACEALFVPDARPPRILVTPGFMARFTPAPEFASQVSVVE